MKKKIFIYFLVFSILVINISGLMVTGRPAIVSTPTDDYSNCGAEWYKTYGGFRCDGGYCVQQTFDGGYIITGITYSFGIGQSDVWLVKTDAQGCEEWNKTFDGGHPDHLIIDYGVYVLQTDDDGDNVKDDGYIVLADMCETYICLIKTDKYGDMEWNKSFNIRRFSEPHCMQQTADGGYIIVGYTSESRFGAYFDTWLIKADSKGNMEWNRTYNRPYWDEGYGVQQTTDGSYIIVGGTLDGLSGYCSMYLFKTNETGVMKWEKTFHRPELDDVGYSIQQTSNGEYIIVGSALFKANTNGDVLWYKPIEGKCVQQTSDGGYIVVGTKNFWVGRYGFDDLNIVKTDAQGTIEWEQTFGGGDDDCGRFVLESPDGGYIVLGSTKSYTPGEFNQEIWLIKLGEKPTLKITKMSGGFGISVVVKNIGLQDLSELGWLIHLDGKLFPFENVFYGKEKIGVIPTLKTESEIYFRNRFVLGIGPGIIQTKVGIITKTANCFLFGPFVIGVR